MKLLIVIAFATLVTSKPNHIVMLTEVFRGDITKAKCVIHLLDQDKVAGGILCDADEDGLLRKLRPFLQDAADECDDAGKKSDAPILYSSLMLMSIGFVVAMKFVSVM